MSWSRSVPLSGPLSEDHAECASRGCPQHHCSIRGPPRRPCACICETHPSTNYDTGRAADLAPAAPQVGSRTRGVGHAGHHTVGEALEGRSANGSKAVELSCSASAKSLWQAWLRNTVAGTCIAPHLTARSGSAAASSPRSPLRLCRGWPRSVAASCSHSVCWNRLLGNLQRAGGGWDGQCVSAGVARQAPHFSHASQLS